MEKIISKSDPGICYHMLDHYVSFRLDGKYVKIRYTQIPIESRRFSDAVGKELMEIYDLVYPVRKCEICGNPFRHVSGVVKTCSKECSEKRRREYDRTKRQAMKRQKKDTLLEKAMLSKCLGMSYGELQSKDTLKLEGGVDVGIL